MINSMYFSKEQFENGEMDKFIHYLNELSYGNGDQKVQILVKPEDCGAYSVEFIQTPWSGDYGGHFEFVEECQVIMTEKGFPDNHYELCYDEEDYKARLEEWLQENPGWKKNDWGMWHYESETDVAKRVAEDLYEENGATQQ